MLQCFWRLVSYVSNTFFKGRLHHAFTAHYFIIFFAKTFALFPITKQVQEASNSEARNCFRSPGTSQHLGSEKRTRIEQYLHHLYYLCSVASFASSSSRTALRCAASVLETRTPAAPWENCDHKLWPPWIQNNLISQDISRSCSCEVLVLQHHFNH